MKFPLSMLVDRVAFVDPASGKVGSQKVKKTRARSAIVVVGQDILLRVFTLYTWADRCSTDALIDKILEVNAQFRPRLFGGESSGLQGLFQDSVIREARYKGIALPLVKVDQPKNQDKDFRIRAALQKIIREGRLFVQAKDVELWTEMLGFPRAQLKDMVDALASAVALLPDRPAVQREDETLSALASYLRETGAEPNYIIRRIDQVRRMLAQRSYEEATGGSQAA